MSYPNVLFVANVNSLKDRRDRLSRSFFRIICKADSCLHHLLPPPGDTSVISRLRSSISLPRPISQIKKFQTFLSIVLLLLLSLSLFALVSYFVLLTCYSAIYSATQPQACNKTQCQCHRMVNIWRRYGHDYAAYVLGHPV